MVEQFDEKPSFDISEIEAEYADSPDILDEIFVIFESETPDRLERLSSGAETGDAAVVQKAAHSLANTSGTLRAERALTLARATEASARAGDIPTMRERAQLLGEEVREILDQIEARQQSKAT
jgi:HPt (histidine-containing phosphotransfer) domain-containing protein